MRRPWLLGLLLALVTAGIVVALLGIGHAILTDGGLDDAGTAVLAILGAVGLIGIPAAHVTRTRRARLAAEK